MRRLALSSAGRHGRRDHGTTNLVVFVLVFRLDRKPLGKPREPKMADVNGFAASIERPFRHDWPDCPGNLESHARKTGAHKLAVHSSKSPAEADANRRHAITPVTLKFRNTAESMLIKVPGKDSTEAFRGKFSRSTPAVAVEIPTANLSSPWERR